MSPTEAASVALRPFPHPYRAAMAICSDIDCCTTQTFLDVHRFLNRQLGLPVADSFFGVGQVEGQMAYFEADGRTPSADAPLIRQAIKDRLIDSLHSWGDFNNAPPEPEFLRLLARELTAEMGHHELRVKIWINHGDPNNRQNFKARLQADYRGDDPTSPYYTAALARLMGVKFFWHSELVHVPLSGRLRYYSPRAWPRLGANLLKNEIKALMGKAEMARPSVEMVELCHRVIMGDGRAMIAFNRFNIHPKGVWGLPTRHTIHYNLNVNLMAELINQGGYLILYTHFGLPMERGNHLFPPRDRRALEALAKVYHAGRIWVAPTLDLLTHRLVVKGLIWSAVKEGETTVIKLESIDDPVTGPRPPDPEELPGLCFYVDEPERTVIRLGANELPSKTFPPDHTGRPSIGFPPPPPPELNVLEG